MFFSPSLRRGLSTTANLLSPRAKPLIGVGKKLSNPGLDFNKHYLEPRQVDPSIYPRYAHQNYPFPSYQIPQSQQYFVVNNPVENLEAPGRSRSRRYKQPDMLAFLDIISTPTVDTPGACLRLHCDNRHYVFGNVAEGTQRIMSSKRVSLTRVEDIFLSGTVDWHATGGLLGFLLTIADSHENQAASLKEMNKEKAAKGKKVTSQGLNHINIHAARGLTHMLASARRFVFRKKFPLVPQEIRTDPRRGSVSSDEPDWADENIRVWYVPLLSEKATATQLSKSKKRKAEHMSDSDGDDAAAQPESGAEAASAPSQDEIDHRMRSGVVRKMFNGFGDRRYQTVDSLQEVKLGSVREGVVMFVRDEQGELKPYNGPRDPKARVLVREDWKASDILHLPPAEPAHMSMCYVVKVQPPKGKFNIAKAKELEIEKSDYKLLVDGKTVPGKDGMEVTPEMVLGPAPEATGFALVEVPDASYIADLLARPEWSNEKIMSGITYMYWIVRSPEVLRDERVLSFMQRNSSVKHVVLSRTESNSPCLVQDSALVMRRLNLVNSDIFPSLAHTDGGDGASPPPDTSVPYEFGITGAQLRLRPKVAEINDNLVAPVKEEEVMERLHAEPDILQLAAEAKAKVSDPNFIAQMEAATADLLNRDAEIIPLGTGSAIPSRLRNVSCTLIRVPGIGSYLLDCGENSLNQLQRLYGFDGADEVLRDLKAIWTSHSHADHHLGTVSVLKRFSQVVPLSPNPETQQKLAVIAHPLYHHFLAEYSQLEPIGLTTHITQLSNDTLIDPPSPANDFTKDLLRPLDDPALLSPFGLSRVAFCKVDHCDDARAVALTLTSGLKIAYSGDCRPSGEFASERVGRDAHVLIHEATLDDDLQRDAVAKKHCTISEALSVARQMRAQNVLLTHFSQRYPKLPEISNADGYSSPVLFAFDFMRVRLGEFRAAREFLPALQRLYDDGEWKTAAEKAAQEAEQRVLREKSVRRDVNRILALRKDVEAARREGKPNLRGLEKRLEEMMGQVDGEVRERVKAAERGKAGGEGEGKVGEKVGDRLRRR